MKHILPDARKIMSGGKSVRNGDVVACQQERRKVGVGGVDERNLRSWESWVERIEMQRRIGISSVEVKRDDFYSDIM